MLLPEISSSSIAALCVSQARRPVSLRGQGGGGQRQLATTLPLPLHRRLGVLLGLEAALDEPGSC